MPVPTRSALRTLTIAAGALAAATVVAAPSALAATGYTITAGTVNSGKVAFTATGKSIAISDVATGTAVNCTSSTIKGSVKLGTAVPGAHFGSVTRSSWVGCKGPVNLGVSAQQVGTWFLNATGPTSSSGVTRGSISGITLNIVVAGNLTCTFTVSGAVDAAYSNIAHTVSVATVPTSANKLKVSAVNGCFGQIVNGDVLSFKGKYLVTTPAGAVRIR